MNSFDVRIMIIFVTGFIFLKGAFMRRLQLLLTILLLIPALSWADDIHFFSHGWADSSGKDGKGGVSIVCDGDKHNFLVRPDFSKDKIDSKTNADHPDWIVYDSDSNDGNCLSYEFTYVTTASDKFWGKKWAGGGVAFDNSWAAHNFAAAKYLVFSVKTNAPGVDFNIALSGTADGLQTGNVKISDFAEGHKIGETWTKVIIPIASFPSLSKIDLTQVKMLRFDLLGDYPENKLVFVHFDKVYFTEAGMVTPVENFGWLRVPGGLEFVWDKSNDDGITGYRVIVDGRVAGEVPKAGKKQVKLLDGWFKGTGSHVVSVAAVSGKQSSSAASVTVTAPSPAGASASVSLSSTPGRAISPYIYGLNGWGWDPHALKKIGTTLNRWGGNATTNYNWKEDAENRGGDWYFLNTSDYSGGPESAKSYYKFAQDTFAGNSDMMITIPLIGWVAKAPPKDGRLSSYPLSLFPNQEANDNGAGNGYLPGKKEKKDRIWGNDPNYNYIPSTPETQKEWVQTMVKSFGPASKGGVKFYSMDNESGLWQENHRDVCPMGIGYEDKVDLNAQYGAMVKSVDPGAQIVGMVSWGVMELAGSAWDYMPGGKAGYKLGDSAMTEALKWTDRKAHGDLPQAVYFLKEMKKRSDQAGVRLLDYFDDHGFPEVWGTNAKGEKMNVLGDLPYDPILTPKQFDAMRVFWDDTFVSPDSWCYAYGNAPMLWTPWVGLIPKLKKMIAENYPGTKLAMTEYYPSSKSYYHGALLEAVNLGIFAREGMDLACDWGGAEENNYVLWGHRIFSNYDGNGSKFGGNYVAAVSSSSDLYSFGAQNGPKTFVVLVNKNHDSSIAATITLPKAVTGYETYTLTETSGKRLFDSGPLAAAGSALQLEVPAFSAILVVAQ